MIARILVAYATRLGSTTDVAETIGQVLRDAGADVEVLPVAEVTDLDGYDAVVLGSAIRVGKPLPELVQFARQHELALSGLPVAYFVVCATMKEDTPEHRDTVLGYLDPLRHIKEPLSIGLFAGAFEYGKVNRLVRWFLKALHAPEGDWRKWDEIRSWAADLATRLAQRTAELDSVR
jgi:menaquinone-dependent protoporphyrinogen oxidase